MKAMKQVHLNRFKQMTKNWGMSVRWLSPYHARVENKLDVWPSTRKYQFVREDGGMVRGIGQYEKEEELLNLLEW